VMGGMQQPQEFVRWESMGCGCGLRIGEGLYTFLCIYNHVVAAALPCRVKCHPRLLLVTTSHPAPCSAPVPAAGF
jgi:hypothetical protein